MVSLSNQDQSNQPVLFIVAGERGFKAAQQVGLSTVPGICVEASTQPGRVGGGWKANYQGLTPFIKA